MATAGFMSRTNLLLMQGAPRTRPCTSSFRMPEQSCTRCTHLRLLRLSRRGAILILNTCVTHKHHFVLLEHQSPSIMGMRKLLQVWTRG